MNKDKLESAKNLFFIALVIDIAVTGMVVISDFWGAGILKDVSMGIATADQSTISTMEFWDSFAKVMILTLIGVGLGLVKWLNTCYQYAKESVGAAGFKNDGWTATGWIIPIFNLFKPYQVINEIYKAGTPAYAIPDGWKKESGSGLLLTWWIFYAVTHLIGWIVSKQMLKSALRDDITLQQSIGMIEFHAWFCVMSLIIAGLWFAVAGGLTRRLLERQSLGGNSLASVRSVVMSSPILPIKPPTFTPIQATRVVAVAAQEEVSQAAPINILGRIDPNDEDAIYTIVAEELETGKTDKGLWTRLFAECGGDEKQVKVLYITRRVEKLMGAEKARTQLLDYKEAERLEQENLREQAAEKVRRAKAGIADPKLVDAVWNGNWTVASQLLETGASPFDTNNEGISLLDLAKKRGDKQIVTLLKDFSICLTGGDSISPSMDDERVSEAVANFQSGKTPTDDEVIFLTQAALKNPAIAKISDQLHNNTLLHWCARLRLIRSASILIRLHADATVFNDSGQQAHQLTKFAMLRTMLAAAANGAPVTK